MSTARPWYARAYVRFMELTPGGRRFVREHEADLARTAALIAETQALVAETQAFLDDVEAGQARGPRTAAATAARSTQARRLADRARALKAAGRTHEAIAEEIERSVRRVTDLLKLE